MSGILNCWKHRSAVDRIEEVSLNTVHVGESELPHCAICDESGRHRRDETIGLGFRSGAAAFLTALGIAFSPCYAAVTISSDKTQNMTCLNGVCSPTSTGAVLNVTDLENLLSSGSVIVTTTGSGVEANDVSVEAALGWSSSSALSFNAYDSISIDQGVSISGQSGLSLTTNNGGSNGVLSIGRKGDVVFQNLSSQLTINGASYVLVNSISSLANAIATNPGGAYAFASPYDASGDGTYASSPIETLFSGTLEGLGNSISNLSIKNDNADIFLGLFSVNFGGSIAHLGLTRSNVVGARKGHNCIGLLAGVNEGGTLFQDLVSGKIAVRGKDSGVGGLVCDNEGNIGRSFADVRIEGENGSKEGIGGLAGGNSGGTISESFSTGPVVLGSSAIGGGLVGINTGSFIENSYATAPVTGGSDSQIGGLIGQEVKSQEFHQTIQSSYSTGAVTGGLSSLVGGFAGKSNKQSSYMDAYWDVTTSGTSQATGKGHSRGIVGETTVQLQSGLPAGFDPAIWGEKANINNGLPYLINNPPPKK